jgi:uncharacterized protein (TIGR02421 family)
MGRRDRHKLAFSPSAERGPMWNKEVIRELSDRLVEAQRPIRILDAVKWDDSIRAAFFEDRCLEQPRVDRTYYESRPLGFHPPEKRREFLDLERDIQSKLGVFNPVGKLMRRMCREYRAVVTMLEYRGLRDFSEISSELYGSSGDVFHEGDPTVADLGAMMAEMLQGFDRVELGQEEPRTISCEDSVQILQAKLDSYFQDPEHRVRVIVSDGIIADSAAGSDYIKLRKDSFFNERDLRLLEVHEGWVHVATTFNGACQQVCSFLAKGPPSSTVTQEGLAMFMELITFSCHRQRVHRITNRVRAVQLAEQGATFLDVFRFFRDQGFDENTSYDQTIRVFRGSTPTNGPFTKDLSYSRGFVLLYQFIELAVRKGKLKLLPLLFAGKTTLEDIPALAYLVEEGLVALPKYLPPHFADMNGLAAWMCFSNFLNHLDMRRNEADWML